MSQEIPSDASGSLEMSEVLRLLGPLLEKASMTTTAVPYPSTITVEEYLPTFSGKPEDDPEVFIGEVEAYFEALGTPLNNRVQVLVIHRQLRGVAAETSQYFRKYDRSRQEIWARLRRNFGTKRISINY